MIDIEIPLTRTKTYRFFEMVPGLLSWGTLFLPLTLSFINPLLAAYFIILFMIGWLLKASVLIFRVFQGFSRLDYYRAIEWSTYLADLNDLDASIDRLHKKGIKTRIDRLHYRAMTHTRAMDSYPRPDEVYNVLLIATYNESREVLEPTIQSVLDSDYDSKHMILYIAYEERGGEQTEKNVHQLIADYGDKFYYAQAVKHPDGLPHEVIGKGGNINYAAQDLKKYLERAKIDPANVIVTTLDSDNRPHREYLSYLTYCFITTDDRKHKSFQPVPMYLNNIWDAPAPMRILATGNSFWGVTQSVRPHMLRNFSSHAQPMDALIETNFWSSRSIVEDGHQFWRSYVKFRGNHEVIPLHIPIYQDAVLSEKYIKTFKSQFIQLRRWAWGASDIAYVATKAFATDSKIPRGDAFAKFMRLIESHWSLATAPLILGFAAWMPLLVNPHGNESIVAHQLPVVASRIMTIATIGIFLTIYLSVKTLPPRPKRYKRRRHVLMVFQWILLPVISIFYGSLSAIYSQTRLMLGKYLDKFEVTEKAVKS